MMINVRALQEALIPLAAAHPLAKEASLLSAEKKMARMPQNFQNDSTARKGVHPLAKGPFNEEIQIQRNHRSEKERQVHLEKTEIVQIDLRKNRLSAGTEKKAMKNLRSKEERQDHSVKTVIVQTGLRRNRLSEGIEMRVMKNLHSKEENQDHSARMLKDLTGLRKNLLNEGTEMRVMKNLRSEKEKPAHLAKMVKGRNDLLRNHSIQKTETKNLFAEAVVQVFPSSEKLLTSCAI